MTSKQDTILFLPVAATSHFNSTFKLANALKQKGYRVVYGTSGSYKDLVAEKGFDFIDLNVTPILSLKHELRMYRKNWLQLFLSNLKTFGKERLKRTKLMVSEYQVRITRLHPDVIFIDSYHVLNAVLLSHLPARIISFNILLPSDKVRGIPPINCDYIPVENKILNDLITELLWRKYFIKRFLKEIVKAIILNGKSNLALYRRLSSATDMHFKRRINGNKFHYGLRDIEEISFAPQKLDFKNAIISQKLFSTSMIDLERKYPSDDIYELALSKARTLQAAKNWPFIYCCLGTLSNFHSPHAVRFLRKLIKVFAGCDKILMISTGRSQSLHHLLSLSQRHNNIFILENTPQLELLDYVDLMITHGGINSIMECISKAVPMLVYPLNASFDQKGNAARVVHHELGLRGKIRGDSCKAIRQRVDDILSDGNRFRRNIKAFNDSLCYEVSVERIIG